MDQWEGPEHTITISQPKSLVLHQAQCPFGPSTPNVFDSLKFITGASCSQESGEPPIAFRFVKDDSGSRCPTNLRHRAALIYEAHKPSDKKRDCGRTK